VGVLRDPQFWIALCAILALVLSQFPPLPHTLRRARLKLTPFRRMVVYHSLGNPNCNLFLIIENTGGRTVAIDGITIDFVKDGRALFTLPAQGYWPALDAKSEFPFTQFQLGGGEIWARMVHFYEEFSHEDERRAAEFINAIKKDIIDQVQAERDRGEKPEDRGHFLVAEEAHVAKAVEFFREHFRYQVGEYEITIQVQTALQPATANVRYRMTLFESAIDTMRRQADRFKYGDGVYFHTDDQERFVSVRIQKA
jgi:hypothetical protein